MTNFITTVRPVYEKLVQLRDEYSKSDVSDPEGALEFIARIEAAEHNVLVAWAKSTRDINPTMLDDVETGRMKWYPALNNSIQVILLTLDNDFGANMSERTLYLKRFVDSKLKERGVSVGDHQAAHTALSRCVLGSQLIKAYDELYNTGE